MDLTSVLLRAAARRPHVLIVPAIGGTPARLAVEASVARRGWPTASAPADADIVVVAGSPGPELAAVIERVWRQVPRPRARVAVPQPADVDQTLDDAVELLVDRDHQRAPTSRDKADLARSSAVAAGGGQHDHGERNHAGHEGHPGHGGHGEPGGSREEGRDDHSAQAGHGEAEVGRDHEECGVADDVVRHEGDQEKGHGQPGRRGDDGHHGQQAHEGEPEAHDHSEHEGHAGHEGHGRQEGHGGHQGHASHQGHGGHYAHHGHGAGMEMPGGLPMAELGEDRDGLTLDRLHVPLGPVLPDWPAGLVVRVTLQGDVIQEAAAEVLDAVHGGASGGQVVDVAARELDALARFLGVAGWADMAARSRRLRDALLDGNPAGELAAPASGLVRRIRRSRTLRWLIRGILAGGTDVAGLLERRLAVIEEAVASLQAQPASRPSVEELPGLLVGAELAAARLIVAAADPDTERVRLPEGARHG